MPCKPKPYKKRRIKAKNRVSYQHQYYLQVTKQQRINRWRHKK